jgi:hypothetical protein
VFTARYALSPYIKQIRFVFKGLSGSVFCKTVYLYDLCSSERIVTISLYIAGFMETGVANSQNNQSNLVAKLRY